MTYESKVVSTSHWRYWRNACRWLSRPLGWLLLMGVLLTAHANWGMTHLPGVTHQSVQQRVDAGSPARDLLDAQLLQPGRAIERKLAGDQSHSFQLTLAPDQYVCLVVESGGIDVAARLYEPHGNQVVEIMALHNFRGPEPASFVTKTSGSYRLEVRPLGKQTATGVYRVDIVELRAATPQDRPRLEASLAFAKGTHMQWEMWGKLNQQRMEQIKKEIQASQGETPTSFSISGNQQANEQYKKALQLWRAADDRRGEAYTLYRLASFAEERLAYLDQALPLWQALGDRRLEAATLSRLGLEHAALGEKQQAIELLRQTLPLWPAAIDQANTLYQIGQIYLSLGDHLEALKHIKATLPFWRELGNRRSEAEVLFSLSNVYSSLGDDQEKLSYLNQALPLWQQVGDREKEAETLNRIGLIYSATGERKALDYFNQALPLWRAVGDRRKEADTLNYLGSFHSSIGKRREALDDFHRAVQLELSNPSPSLNSPSSLSLPLVIDRATGRATSEERRPGETMGEAASRTQKTADLPALNLQRNYRLAATTLGNMAALYSSLGEKQKALDCDRQALKLWQDLKDAQEEARTLTSLAEINFSLGKKREALDHYQRALRQWQILKNRQGELNLLTDLGSVYYSLGERQAALDSFRRIVQLQQEVGSRQGIFNSLAYGSSYASFSEKRKVLDSYGLALQLFRDSGDRTGEAYILTITGTIYSSLGERQTALNHYNQALRLWQVLGDRREEATTLFNIGSVYDSLGEDQGGLSYYNQALSLFRTAGERAGEADVLTGIGSIHLLLGEKKKALDYFNQALVIKQEVGDRAGKADTLTGIGAIYQALGEGPKALENFSQALALRQAIGDYAGKADALCHIGLATAALGEKQKAVDYLSQALRLSRTLGDPNREAKARYGMARVEYDRGHFTESLAQIEKAIGLVESLRVKVAGRELRATFFASVQTYYELHIHLLMRLHRLNPTAGYHAAALQVSERARARSLLETLTEARAEIRQGVSPELLERERALQQRLNARAAAQMERLGSQLTEVEAEIMAQELSALTTEFREIQAQIRQTSPRYAALTQPQPLTLAEIQQQVLDTGTLLLEYALGEERSYLWAVTPTAISSYELPNRAEIEAAERPVHDLLIERSQASKGEADAEYATAAGRLSRMLLGPVANQLGKQRLVIVPDGALHYIPFGALPDPNPRTESHESWQPLVVEHEIVNLPSASTLAVLRRELSGRKPAAKMAVVLADPVFDKDDERVKPVKVEKPPDEAPPNSDWARILTQVGAKFAGQSGTRRIPRLPFTRQEAEGILALMPAGAGQQALDFKASLATATSADLSQYRYVHFATHGYLDSEYPELSAIVLSLVDEQGRPQDGFLRGHEIYNLSLPAELVVLSACETGLGKEIKGEGLLGLTRGVMYAGAPRVVISLWSVSDKATAQLMTKFYRKILVEGQRPAAALRAAQIEMWREQQWAAPYYWAAFTLQGEWR